MEWLTSLYPDVRELIETSLPDYWSEQLGTIFDQLFSQPPPLLSVALLPLACCHAVGGDAKAAVPVSAALISAEISMRILDDVEDKDRADQLWTVIGEARAINYASALQVYSFEILNKSISDDADFRRVNQLFIDAYFRILIGQEYDLRGLPESVEEYWHIMELKTATAYAVACAAGATVGTDDATLVEACNRYGHHIGLAIQIFNDMESIWLPNGQSDLEQGKLTLPLIYGLTADHEGRSELATFVRNGQIAAFAQRIKQILDSIDTKQFLLWAAIQQRDEALKALALCPNSDGRAALEAYITSMFGDLDALLAER